MKPNTPWAHLPNAARIDWCLADVRRRPEVWGAAMSAATSAATSAAREAAWEAANVAVARNAGWDAAQGAARAALKDNTWSPAQAAAWGATMALLAWDDCAQLLDAPVEAVRLMAAAGHHPAVLLLPAVIVRNTP